MNQLMALTDSDLILIASATDAALKTPNDGIDEARELVARSVLHAFHSGERNPIKLLRAGEARLREAVCAATDGRSRQSN